MQKVLRRSQNAKRLAAKKGKELQQSKERVDITRYNEGIRRIQGTVARNIKAARLHRREDWETGSLAPRRDVADQAEAYGAVNIYDFYVPDKLAKHRVKWWPVDTGDRVVMNKGRDRGKIGTVESVNEKKGMVTVKDLNRIDIWVPEWIRQEDNDDRKIIPHEMSVPVEHVSLVYPLPDPKTGKLRDTVIDRVVQLGKSRDRLVPGSNIVIRARPKPKEQEDEESYPADTPTASVDEETFNPPLLFPPMPTSVIDELRFKYSKFRTRHDYEYLEEKRKEDEKIEARKELGKTMRTPLQELAELRAKQKEAAKKELTDEQLAQIGAIMSQEKERVILAIKRPAIPLPPQSAPQIDASV